MFLPNRHSFHLVSRARAEIPSPGLALLDASSTEDPTTAEVDSGKRTFLRLAGLVGIGIAASSMLPKKAEAYVLGSAPTSPVVGVKNSSNTRVDPATEGTLGLVQGQTAKLTFDGSNNLYVQAATNFTSQLENASSVLINPATEDSLAAIKSQTNQFTFTGGALVTTSSGGGASGSVNLQDTTDTQINPATDDSLQYLRRMVKLMESQAAVDSANRQRITIDSLGTATAVTTTLPVSGTVTASVSNATVTSLGTLAGQNDQMFQDVARTAYAVGIRQNLIFS